MEEVISQSFLIYKIKDQHSTYPIMDAYHNEETPGEFYIMKSLLERQAIINKRKRICSK